VENNSKPRLLVIGAGGIGATLCRMLHKQYRETYALHVVDNDTVEEANLLRQDFEEADVGRPKAEVLRDRGWAEVISSQSRFTEGFPGNNWQCLFCCADNLQARRDALAVCDKQQKPGILTGNETFSAEAYIYLPAWKNDTLQK